ncbi:MAG: SPOR domain-containing protein [Pseudomonadota bacterium]
MKRNTGEQPGLVPVAVMLVGTLLGGCSTGGPARSDADAPILPLAGSNASYEQRLQALEAGVQLLAQRIEAMQSGTVTALPAEPAAAGYQPVRPGIVLAGYTRQLAPAQAMKPAPPAAAEPAWTPEQQHASAPAQQAMGLGAWVINLASYNSSSYAASKLAEFKSQGVIAEQVSAEVNGSTVYRLRVSGFDSYRSASEQAGDLRARLGLGETWVTRR